MTLRLGPEQTMAVSRVSGLVLTNALIFQEILAEHDQRVPSLHETLRGAHPQSALSEQWDFILREINSFPIFHVAGEVLAKLTSKAQIAEALRTLAEKAQKVVTMRAALRHDLMGRVYHRLLAEAKYLGTYYTGIPAATLLLKLAFRGIKAEWHDPEKLASFRVADLASGTGTLLMAAADAICDLHFLECNLRKQPSDTIALHRVLAEQVLFGYDVLETAVHLTASTLALRAPQITFKKMCLFSLPLGGPDQRLGSIEFLIDRDIAIQNDLFGSTIGAAQATATGTLQSAARLPDLDLCVMNPPFVRSVGGNLLFGSAPKQERKQMRKRLARILRNRNVMASSTAGLGSVFVAAADKALKAGGRLALVLPKAVLSGVAWGKTRNLLRENYRVAYIISSHDPLHWNFSESTNLSEVLLIAEKKQDGPEKPPGKVTIVNLYRNPANIFEALALEFGLRGSAPDLEAGQGALAVCLGNETLGEALSIPWHDLEKRALWILPSAFAQADLIRTAFNLGEGKVSLPGTGKPKKVSLCPLKKLGSLGPDRRDIHDGFRLSLSKTAYSALWGNDSSQVVTLVQRPNQFLSPLSKPKPGRHLRKVEHLWPLAGTLMIAERMRLNTGRLAAVALEERSLSNTWWSFISFIRKAGLRREKVLAMWLNSTLGLLSLLSNRAETEGPWVDFKKPILENLLVPDLRIVPSEQQRFLASAFDRLCHQGLLPLPEMANDPVRAEIDAAVSTALRLPDFSFLRTMLAREPVVCLERL